MTPIAELLLNGFVIVSVTFYLGLLWKNRKERKQAKLAKEQSDAEYNEQQSIHKGDC